MKIEKFYGKNANMGNYESVRLGLTIKYDKDIKSKKQLKKVSNNLLKLAKEIIEEEIKKIKEEKNRNDS